MPVYEFRCNDTGKRFEIRKSYADYNPDEIVSPFTGSDNVSRLISRVRVMRSEMSRLESAFEGDETSMAAIDELEDSGDPRALGRALRHFGRSMEDDLGGEFKEVVGRLESGESPESIEASMPADQVSGDE